jgi:putative inorganic carbon (HCO3(-)) transporter
MRGDVFNNLVKTFTRVVIIIPLVIIIIAPNLHISTAVGFFDSSTYNEKRLLQIFTLLLLVLVPLLSWARKSEWQQLLQQIPTTAWILLSVIFILGSLSLKQSALMRMGWNEFGLTFFIFFGIAAVAALRKDNPALDTILIFGITVMASLFFIRFELFRYLDVFSLDMISNYEFRARWEPWAVAKRSRELLSDFTHPRFFGQFQSWVIPLLTLPFLWSKKRFSKPIFSLLFILPAACWITLLIFSGSRGPWLGLVTAIVVTGVLLKKKALPWIISIMIAILGGSLIYWLLFSAQVEGSGIASHTAGRLTNLNSRPELWNAAWTMSRDYSLLGVGPQHFSYHLDKILIGHPHMSVLRWAAEYGWISTLLLLSLMVWAFSSWVKSTKQSKRDDRDLNIRVALTASIITAASHSLVSGVMIMPLSQLMLVVIIGWIVGIHFSNHPIEKIPWLLVKSIGSLTLILWIGWNFAQSIGPEVQYIISGPHSEITIFNPSEVLHPRFWHQGIIPWIQLPSE